MFDEAVMKLMAVRDVEEEWAAEYADDDTASDLDLVDRQIATVEHIGKAFFQARQACYYEMNRQDMKADAELEQEI